MQTQTIKTELSINGKNVIIGHQFLEDIIRDIPDIKENQEIFSILAQSDNPEVRENVSRMVDNLDKDTIHLLLNDENQEVVDNVLSNSNLAKHISEEEIYKIIDSDNIKLLTIIASNIDDYKRCDLCKIVKGLAKHKNISVRYRLLGYSRGDSVSNKILKQLSEDEDSDISQMALSELKRRN